MNNNCTNNLIDGNPLLYEYCARTFHLINFFLLSVSMYSALGIIIDYRHGMCFRASSVFVLSILFLFPQRTHYF